MTMPASVYVSNTSLARTSRHTNYNLLAGHRRVLGRGDVRICAILQIGLLGVSLAQGKRKYDRPHASTRQRS